MSAIARWLSPPPVYDSHSAPAQTTSLTPYLQLPHLLSLTWLAYPILSLVFVAFRLQISAASAQDSVASAKVNLLASCKAAETAATATASMPRYLALATNQQFADAVNGTMNGARQALVLALTIMETVINFLVDIYRSTFFCFLELIVRGTLSILIAAVQEISDFVTNSLDTIRTSIQNDVSSANSAIQTLVDGVNKINPFNKITAPQFSIPSLSSLQNVTIPTDFEASLIQLNNSLPSIDDIKNSLEALIDTPFEDVKKEINDTFLGISFNPSLLFVPDQNTLSFCGDVDTSVVDNLGNDLIKVTKIGTVIIVAMIILMLLLNCALEWYKWRCLKQHLEDTRRAWNSDPTLYHSGPAEKTPTLQMTNHNLLILQGMSAHPLLMRIAYKMSMLLRLSPSQHIHLQWFFHYVFHPPALACFMIGSFGLASVQLQLLAIGPLAAKYSAQAAASVTNFSDTIATSVNNSMYNQSSAYANQVNSQILTIQNTINGGVFGWVNSTTTTLNTTLVNFYSEVQTLVTTVFGNTILENPMQEFVRCIIGTKVEALEEALTFLHDNLQVDIPTMNQSALVLSQVSINEATQPIARAAIGSGTDGNDGIVGHIVNLYVASLKKEQLMFIVFMVLWFFVVLMALAIVFWYSYGKGWVETYRKKKWHKEQGEGIDQFAPANLNHNETSSNVGNEKGQVNLPSFTPMASPKLGFFDALTSPRRRTGSIGSNRLNPNQGLRKPPQHRLRSLNHSFEKSWDSFIDSSLNDEPVGQKRNFLSLGRKGRGIEQSVSGEERVRDTKRKASEDKRETRSGWLGRMKGVLRKDNQPLVPTYASHGYSRQKPQLSISTKHANTRQDELPAIEKTSASGENNSFSSAWSVSPSAPTSLPRVDRIVPSKNGPALPAVGPLRTKHNGVPSSVVNLTKEVNAEHKPKIFMAAPTPLALPLHHGFQRPVPSGTSRSVSPSLVLIHATPPPTFVLHQPSPAPPVHPTRNLPPDIPPLPSQMLTKHEREPSLADPFVTPFDDESAVASITHTNPFSLSTNKFLHAAARQSVGISPSVI